MNPYNPYNFGIPAYGYSQFNQPQTPMQQEPSIKVPQVHGENGAKAYSLPPNSSILLMDDAEMKEETPVYVTTKEFDKLADKVNKLVKDLGGEKDE